MKPDQLNIVERALAPTPKFFQKLRVIGLVLASVGGVIMTTPIALPVVVIQVAGYITLAGGVLTAASQTAVDESKLKKLTRRKTGKPSHETDPAFEEQD